MLVFYISVLNLNYLVQSETFKIGYITGSERRPGDLLYDRPGRTISGAISLAVDEINGPNGTFGSLGHQLKFVIAETYGEEATSILQIAELWRENISAYIGPQETCFHEGRMAAAFNTPMISYFCTDHLTSDKKLFPTFARTRPPDSQISKSLTSILLYFQWTHVVFLYLNSSDNPFGKIASTIMESFDAANIHVERVLTWSEIYYHTYGQNPFETIVEETYMDTRIYVILGYYYEHMGLMVAMQDKGILDNGEYFVVGVDIEQYDYQDASKYFRQMLSSKYKPDPYAERAFQSYISVKPTSIGVTHNKFTENVNLYLERPPFNFRNPLMIIGGTREIPPEAAYLYDAVHIYAKAVITVMENDGDPRNGTTVINAIKGVRYRSAMGFLSFIDENGDAEGNYTVLAWRPLNQSFTNVSKHGLFPVGVFGFKSNVTQFPILHLISEIYWRKGRPPAAQLRCGFRNERCITHSKEFFWGSIISILLVVFITSLILYRNWRYEQELDSLLWKIDYKEIEMHDDNARIDTITTGTDTKITPTIVISPDNNNPTKERAYHPLIRTSQVSLSSNPDADFRYSSIFTRIGVYKGRIYAVKKIHKKSIEITRAMKKELKIMRDLRHSNLNAFVGACTDVPNICVITEYCSRGSLKDILENEEVKLDNMFVASIVADILRGMIYLHDSPIHFHGNLCSSNCLIDSRWVVKLADFGLYELKSNSIEETKFDDSQIDLQHIKYEYLLYRAPEILRSNLTEFYSNNFQMYFQVASSVRGTQKGDIYSFSIILFELHSRHGPFGETGLSSIQILQRVVGYTKDGGSVFRPNLESLHTSFDFVIECLKDCWAENPDDRPDFKTVRTKLRPLRKGMKPNIFDNMMAMMEKYANNLEVLVDERTDQLQEEKKKTDALLLEMLPRPVAEQLKRGEKVDAESYDSVTIYFSDIVGFTSMSAESTPLEVVDFLNDLYTCFDSIIQNYDVYKVETIGDAYMVVSGLPIRNENQHSAEIATMSLHLLSAVKNFTIRHRPGEKLKLRIGIHSGPVCAGVVGLKMPRYCLFGDTVNTTSRMESTGEPLKIHCSEECRQLLTKLGGYYLSERGLVEMKGKGAKQTYWLVGEDPYKRAERTEARSARRKLSSNQQLKLHQNDGIVQRSSLKNRNSPKLPRCTSLESSKRLRFASGDRLELYHHRLDSISDNNINATVENGGSGRRRLSSSSCPCIENLANERSNEAMFCLSHPNLFRHISKNGGVNADSLTIPNKKGYRGDVMTPLLGETSM